MKSRKRRTCLVLGATGFLGKNLCRALVQHGDEVIAYGRNPERLQELLSVAQGVSTIRGDFVRDGVSETLLQEADVVFHLISTTKPANKDVLKEFETNVLPTIRLMDACVSHQVRVIYFSSGGTVYGVPRYVPMDEGHRTDPISAYGIHKLAVEKCIEYYGRTYELDYSILRISNPYGRFQDAQANQGVIAVFLAHALRKEPLEVWGDGAAVRDYVYVDDVMDACMKLLDYHGDERIFNIGSGKGFALREIIHLIERETGQNADVRYQPSRIQDVPANILDCSIAARELGWRPSVGLSEGIHRLHMMWNQGLQRL